MTPISTRLSAQLACLETIANLVADDRHFLMDVLNHLLELAERNLDNAQAAMSKAIAKSLDEHNQRKSPVWDAVRPQDSSFVRQAVSGVSAMPHAQTPPAVLPIPVVAGTPPPFAPVVGAIPPSDAQKPDPFPFTVKPGEEVVFRVPIPCPTRPSSAAELHRAADLIVKSRYGTAYTLGLLGLKPAVIDSILAQRKDVS